MIGMMIVATSLAAAAPAERAITAPGPNADLAGTLVDAGKGKPVVVIIPGSGPTDRDGNNPLGVKAAPYRLLAESLGKRGISSVRIDKRGMFQSKGAIADANDVTIADYAEDAHAWANAARAATGAKCAWLLGHSEGALVALAAAQKPAGICGVITVSGAGRPIGTVIREQLRANPANAPLLSPALAALDSLEAGKTVSTEGMPPPLLALFNDKVQPYLIDLMRYHPTALAGSLTVPLLIVQGDSDVQVGVGDARALAAAQPKAKLAVLPGVNHVLKEVPAGADRTANLTTYADPSLPLAPSVAEAIASYVLAGK